MADLMAQYNPDRGVKRCFNPFVVGVWFDSVITKIKHDSFENAEYPNYITALIVDNTEMTGIA